MASDGLDTLATELHSGYTLTKYPGEYSRKIRSCSPDVRNKIIGNFLHFISFGWKSVLYTF